MSKRIGQGLAAVTLLAVAASPAWADRRTDERLQALEDRMERVDRLMQNNALLDLVTRMDAMQQELRELRGQNEELAHELETLKSRQRELYLDLDRRIQDVETAGTSGASVSPVPSAAPAAAVPAAARTAPAPSASAPPPGSAPAATGVAPSSERDAYKQAFDLLREGQYRIKGDYLILQVERLENARNPGAEPSHLVLRMNLEPDTLTLDGNFGAREGAMRLSMERGEFADMLATERRSVGAE